VYSRTDLASANDVSTLYERPARIATCAPGAPSGPACRPSASSLPDPEMHAVNAPVDFLWLELTPKCNLRCVHCYADSGPEMPVTQRMSAGDWINALREASELGCRKVQFIGGEPTVYPQLPVLIAAARQFGYELVEVFTNGTAFSEHVKSVFALNQVSLAFSVYGATAPIHDSVTMQDGSFDRTVANVKWAVKQKLNIRVEIIEMSQNSSTVDDTVRFFKSLGVATIGIDRLRAIGRAANGVPSQMDELCGDCWKGKLCVAATGQIFPCVFSRFYPVGSVEEGVGAAVASHSLSAFRASLAEKMRQHELTRSSVSS